MLKIADCIPIFIYDPRNQAVGLVHSGWRGSLGKIALVAIEKMMFYFESRPEDLLLALGPSLQPCCNTFTNQPIQNQLPEWNRFVWQKKGKYTIDLQEFVVKTLVDAGVRRKNLEISPICTYMDEQYFSHTRAKTTGEKSGRFAALIGIKN